MSQTHGMPGPASFLGGGNYRPEPAPISRIGEDRAAYVPRGPANTEPILSVSSYGECTLSKPLQVAANLRAGQFVHLIVPRQRGHEWYLDTNPKPGAGTQLPERGRQKFRTGPISPMHFQVSRPREPGYTPGSITNRFTSLLHFRLGEEVEGHPGYYRLLRGLPAVEPRPIPPPRRVFKEPKAVVESFVAKPSPYPKKQIREVHQAVDAPPNVLLDPSTVQIIRERYAKGGITQEALGEEYGVSQYTISSIINKRTWRRV